MFTGSRGAGPVKEGDSTRSTILERVQTVSYYSLVDDTRSVTRETRGVFGVSTGVWNHFWTVGPLLVLEERRRPKYVLSY